MNRYKQYLISWRLFFIKKFNILKVTACLVASILFTGAFALFSFDSVAHATHNLWRCSRCGAQTQTSSSNRPASGTCAYSRNGHDWQYVP